MIQREEPKVFLDTNLFSGMCLKPALRTMIKGWGFDLNFKKKSQNIENNSSLKKNIFNQIILTSQ